MTTQQNQLETGLQTQFTQFAAYAAQNGIKLESELTPQIFEAFQARSQMPWHEILALKQVLCPAGRIMPNDQAVRWAQYAVTHSWPSELAYPVGQALKEPAFRSVTWGELLDVDPAEYMGDDVRESLNLSARSKNLLIRTLRCVTVGGLLRLTIGHMLDAGGMGPSSLQAVWVAICTFLKRELPPARASGERVVPIDLTEEEQAQLSETAAKRALGTDIGMTLLDPVFRNVTWRAFFAMKPKEAEGIPLPKTYLRGRIQCSTLEEFLEMKIGDIYRSAPLAPKGMREIVDAVTIALLNAKKKQEPEPPVPAVPAREPLSANARRLACRLSESTMKRDISKAFGDAGIQNVHLGELFENVPEEGAKIWSLPLLPRTENLLYALVPSGLLSDLLQKTVEDVRALRGFGDVSIVDLFLAIRSKLGLRSVDESIVQKAPRAGSANAAPQKETGPAAASRPAPAPSASTGPENHEPVQLSRSFGPGMTVRTPRPSRAARGESDRQQLQQPRTPAKPAETAAQTQAERSQPEAQMQPQQTGSSAAAPRKQGKKKSSRNKNAYKREKTGRVDALREALWELEEVEEIARASEDAKAQRPPEVPRTHPAAQQTQNKPLRKGAMPAASGAKLQRPQHESMLDVQRELKNLRDQAEALKTGAGKDVPQKGTMPAPQGRQQTGPKTPQAQKPAQGQPRQTVQPVSQQAKPVPGPAQEQPRQTAQPVSQQANPVPGPAQEQPRQAAQPVSQQANPVPAPAREQPRQTVQPVSQQTKPVPGPAREQPRQTAQPVSQQTKPVPGPAREQPRQTEQPGGQVQPAPAASGAARISDAQVRPARSGSTVHRPEQRHEGELREARAPMHSFGGRGRGSRGPTQETVVASRPQVYGTAPGRLRETLQQLALGVSEQEHVRIDSVTFAQILDVDPNRYMSVQLSTTGFSPRARMVLQRAGCRTLGDIYAQPALRFARHSGVAGEVLDTVWDVLKDNAEAAPSKVSRSDTVTVTDSPVLVLAEEARRAARSLPEDVLTMPAETVYKLWTRRTRRMRSPRNAARFTGTMDSVLAKLGSGEATLDEADELRRFVQWVVSSWAAQ